jgi:hypothetical protein
MSPQVKPGGFEDGEKRAIASGSHFVCEGSDARPHIMRRYTAQHWQPHLGCLATWLHHAVTKSIGMCLALTPPVGAYKLLLQPVAGQVRRHQLR